MNWKQIISLVIVFIMLIEMVPINTAAVEGEMLEEILVKEEILEKSSEKVAEQFESENQNQEDAEVIFDFDEDISEEIAEEIIEFTDDIEQISEEIESEIIEVTEEEISQNIVSSEVVPDENTSTTEGITETDNQPLIVTGTNDYNCSSGSTVSIFLQYTYNKKWDNLTWSTESGGTAHVTEFSSVGPGEEDNGTESTWWITVQVENRGEEDSVITGVFSVDGSQYEVKYNIHNVLVVPITEPELSFSQGVYSCGVNGAITLTANYKYSSQWDSISWSCATDGVVTFGEEVITSPSEGETGAENMWWISVPVTALLAGEYTISVSAKVGEKECSANVVLKVEEDNPLSFAEESYICLQNTTIGLTAIYESVDQWDNIIWECSDNSAVLFSSVSTVFPGMGGTGKEDTWWASVQITGLKTGSYTITVTAIRSEEKYNCTTTLVVMEMPDLFLGISNNSALEEGDTVSAHFSYGSAEKWDNIEWSLSTSEGASIISADIRPATEIKHSWDVDFLIDCLKSGDYTLSVSVEIAGESFTKTANFSIIECLYTGTIDYDSTWFFNIDKPGFSIPHLEYFEKTGDYIVISNNSGHISSSLEMSDSIGKGEGKQSVFYTIDEYGDIDKIVAYEDAITPEITKTELSDHFVYCDGKWEKESVKATVYVTWRYKPECGISRGSIFASDTFSVSDCTLSISGAGFDSAKVERNYTEFTITAPKEAVPSQSAQTAIVIPTVYGYGGESFVGKPAKLHIGNLDYQRQQSEEIQREKDESNGIDEIADELQVLKERTKLLDDPNLMQWFGDEEYARIQDYLILYLGEVLVYDQTTLEEILDFVDDEIQFRIRKKLGVQSAHSFVNSALLGLNFETIDAETSIYATSVDGDKVQIDFSLTISKYGQRDKNPFGAYVTIFYDIDGKKPSGAISNSGETMSTYVDFDAFSNVIIKYVKTAYMDVWGKSADKVATFLVSDLFNKVIGGKYTSRIYDLSVKALKKGIKKYSIFCPVDMYVYDCNGKLCGAIVDDEVAEEYSEVLMAVHEETKVAYLAGGDYYIKFVGNDTGTMDYVIEEYDESGLTRTVSIYEVPLSKGKTYHTVAPDIQGIDPNVFVLEGDAGEEIYAEEDSDGEVILTEYQPVHVVREGTCGEDAYWTLYSDGVMEISGTGVIGDCKDGFNPTYHSFHYAQYSHDIRHVVIHEGITGIGTYAFRGLMDLAVVTIPNSVTTIGRNAFYQCGSLTCVYIGSGLQELGWCAFSYCGSTLAYFVSDDNPNFCTIDNALYSKDGSYLHWFPRISSEEYVIPEGVTHIGDDAFGNHPTLKSITLPDSLEFVGEYAFDSCAVLEEVHVSSLTEWCSIEFESLDANPISYATLNVNGIQTSEIVIPTDVTSIGKYAFAGCKNINHITVPETVEQIGDYAFSHIDTPCQIVFEGSLPSMGDGIHGHSGDGVFADSDSLISVGPVGGGYSIEIGDMTQIPKYAFSACSGLATINLTEDVVSIGEYAFTSCVNLSEVYFPKSVKEIGDGAFWGCEGLKKISIPSTLDKLGECVFRECPEIISAGPIGGEYDYQFGWTEAIPAYAFDGCENLQEITLPKSITALGTRAFGWCSQLQHVEIPEGVISFGEDVFYCCDQLSTAGPVGTGASIEFYWVESIPDNAFNGSEIRDIIIPESIQSIGDYAFAYTELTNVILPKKLSFIGDSAFYFTSIAEMILPDSVTTIGNGAFAYSEITRITLPDGLKKIGFKTFYYCKSLTQITIPEAVSEIEGYAFSDCVSLASITLPENLETLGGGVFQSCDALTEITIPDTVMNIPGYTFFDCQELSRVTLSGRLESIDSYAFYQCTSLKDIYFNSTEEYWHKVEIDSIGNDCLNNVTMHYADAPLEPPEATEQPTDPTEPPTDPTDPPTDPTDPSEDPTEPSEHPTDPTDPSEDPETPTEPTENMCGKSAYWLLSDDGVLTISGEGKMDDFDRAWNICPWDEERDKIQSVIISEGITHIGSDAFRDCPNLTDVLISNTVVSIAEKAFQNCTSLPAITIPDSVKTLGYLAFDGCTGLVNIDLSDQLTSIGENAFYECSALLGITFPASITEIGENALFGCTSLEDIVFLGDAPTVIGLNDLEIFHYDLVAVAYYPKENATWNHSIAKSYGGYITWLAGGPDELPSGFCGENITWNLNADGHLTVFGNGDMEDYNNFGTYPAPWKFFSNQILEITVSDGITHIGDFSFFECSSAAKITVGKNICTIGESVFEGCCKITELLLPEGLEKIGDSAFSDCTSLTVMDIPTTVSQIGFSAFNSCKNIEEIVIPDGVKEIKAWTFQYCNYLTTITLPEKLESIGVGAFWRCWNLQNIEIPASVTEIGESAFYDTSPNRIIFWGNAPEVEFVNDTSVFDTAYSTVYYPANDSSWTDDIKTAYGPNLTWITFDTQATEKGSCGEAVQWEFNSESGILRIYGTGKMEDYQNSGSGYGVYDYPWFLQTEHIQEIAIEEGVTSIGTYAFAGCGNVKQVTIPASMETMGQNAFMSCSNIEAVHIFNLESWLAIDFNFAPSNPLYYGSAALILNGTKVEKIVIPSSIATLEEATFAGCSSIKSIYLPDTITSIDGAFWMCNNMEEVHIANLEKWCTLNFAEYSSNPLINGEGIKLYLNESLVEKLIIPEGITEISNYAFVNCESITSVSFPEGLSVIGASAFMDCCSLTDIHIPASLEKIASGAFVGCVSLEEVHVEDLLDWFELEFEYADANPLYEEATLYVNGSVLTDVVVPDDVLILPNYTFAGYGKLKSISMHDMITGIGEGAFLECTGLNSLVIPQNVTEIGINALRACSNLLDVTFEGIPAVIPSYMFADCSSLTTIELPNGIKEIGAGAFAGCIDLQRICIPDSVEKIGSNTFASCEQMQTVELSDNIVSLESGVFSGCTTLTSITIPASVISIGPSAFRGCSNLVSIIIPKSVTQIEYYAFGNCTGISTIRFGGNAPQIGMYAFQNVVADAYYSVDNDSWTGEVLQNYGGQITWCSDAEIIPEFAFKPMGGYLTLKNEVFLTVYYTFTNQDELDIEKVKERSGLLVWNADEAPEEANAIYENCNNPVSDTTYLSGLSRFETKLPGIPAKEMGDALAFRPYYQLDDGSYVYGRYITSYSPKTYCYNKLKDSDVSDDALMVAILNYGAAAQNALNHRTDDLMNANLTAEQKALVWDGSLVRSDWNVPTEKAGELTKNTQITTRGGYLTLKGAIDYAYYAMLDTSISIEKAEIFYWTESDYNSVDVLTLENATASEDMTYVEYSDGKKRYEAVYEGLPARYMFSPVYACAVFTDTEGNMYYGGAVAYCPERYGYMNQNSIDPNTAAMAKRMVIYGDAARNYFGQE